jgi:hypothetical protein
MTDDLWFTSLQIETPQEGFELAITLSRRGVKYTQLDVEVLKRLRPDYAESADSLAAVSQVIAINSQTIAAANNYWRT